MRSASWTTYADGPVWYKKASAAAWARRLADNGVNTELHMFSGTVHGLATIPGTPSWESLLKLIADFNQQLILPSS